MGAAIVFGGISILSTPRSAKGNTELQKPTTFGEVSMLDPGPKAEFRSGAGWDWALSRSEIYHRLGLMEKDTQPVGHRASFGSLARGGPQEQGRDI